MKLSIITINFNNALGLEKTICSVIEQCYTNYEYIVIDGGSTDGSVEIINKYADKITYWVSEPDSGIYNAMNKGILKSKGEYLLFLNSADSLLNKNVLHNVFHNKVYTSLLIRGNIILDKEQPEKYLNKGNKIVTLRDLIDSSLYHQATFIHNVAFIKYGLYDEDYKIVSDWKLFLQMIFNGENTEYINIDICLFDVQGISNSEKTTELMEAERQTVLSNIIPKAILSDYTRFIELEKKIDFSQQYYITNFLIAHRFPRVCMRVLHQIYTALKL